MGQVRSIDCKNGTSNKNVPIPLSVIAALFRHLRRARDTSVNKLSPQGYTCETLSESSCVDREKNGAFDVRISSLYRGRPPDGLRPGALPAARARRRGDPRRADADALRCTHARTVFAGSHTAAPQLEDSKPPLSLWQKEGQWAKQVRVNDEFANEGDGFASTVFPKR